jgi:hypothetical protein
MAPPHMKEAFGFKLEDRVKVGVPGSKPRTGTVKGFARPRPGGDSLGMSTIYPSHLVYVRVDGCKPSNRTRYSVSFLNFLPPEEDPFFL